MKAANRLLVVDDDVDIATLIQTVAAGCGYEVEIATDKTAFLRQVESGFPTHIVLDLNMPTADGIELLRVLSEKRSAARIVIASGVDGRVVEAARRIGQERGLDVVGTLLKPFRTAALRELLTAHLLQDDSVSEAELANAIAEGQLFLVYQPKIALDGGAVEGYEGLVRWRHPRRGTVMPDAFIPLAEAAGLIDALTDAVIAVGIAEMATWRDRASLSLALNMSGRSLLDLTFADRLAALCAEQGVAPHRLVLELTESRAMSDPVNAMDIFSRLRLKGFRLAIDDFGTGYSSFTQLARLPFSELKIDQSFIREMERSREARTIVKAMIDLAHNLGLQATGEGIEDAGTLHRLIDLKCDHGQGHYVAKPMPAEQIPDWLRFWSKRQAEIVPRAAAGGPAAGGISAA